MNYKACVHSKWRLTTWISSGGSQINLSCCDKSWPHPSFHRTQHQSLASDAGNGWKLGMLTACLFAANRWCALARKAKSVYAKIMPSAKLPLYTRCTEFGWTLNDSLMFDIALSTLDPNGRGSKLSDTAVGQKLLQKLFEYYCLSCLKIFYTEHKIQTKAENSL